MDSTSTPKRFTKTNDIYFEGPYHGQNWSLPDSLMYYITKYPSTSKFYRKIVQSCKHFFAKNPILVCPVLIVEDVKVFQIGSQTFYNHFFARFWITSTLTAYEPFQFTSYVYRSDACLQFWNHEISFSEFSHIALYAEIINLCQATVKNENGSITALENVIQAAVKAKRIYINETNKTKFITSESVKNLIRVLNFSKLQCLELARVPETFDIETLFEYIKENKRIDCSLCFCDEISDAYKNRLTKVVDEIISIEQRDFKPPLIYYEGINQEKLNKLYAIRFKFKKVV